jgi:hypothetical protein
MRGGRNEVNRRRGLRVAKQGYLAPNDHGGAGGQVAFSYCRSLYALALMFPPKLSSHTTGPSAVHVQAVPARSLDALALTVSPPKRSSLSRTRVVLQQRSLSHQGGLALSLSLSLSHQGGLALSLSLSLSLSHQGGFAAARRPVQQHPARRLDVEALERLRVLHGPLHRLPQPRLDVVHAADVLPPASGVSTRALKSNRGLKRALTIQQGLEKGPYNPTGVSTRPIESNRGLKKGP